MLHRDLSERIMENGDPQNGSLGVRERECWPNAPVSILLETGDVEL